MGETLMRKGVTVLLFSLAVCAAAARGQDAAQPPGASQGKSGAGTPVLTDAYCEYTEGAAASEAAPLLAPNSFATGGVFNSELLAVSTPVSTSRANHGRLFAGGEYSFGNLQKGITLKRRARADCEAHRLTAELESFLQNNSNTTTTGALAARASVFREALPQGETILEATAKSVESFSTTIQEADAVRLRLDELRRMLEDTEREKILATPSEAFAEVSLPRLLEQAQALQRELEKREANAREAAAWDFTVRGGYDHIFLQNVGRPYFAMGTLTFNLGSLWQKKADARAAEARQKWFLEQPDGVAARTQRLLRQLRGMKQTEEVRFRETQILLADLEQPMKSLQEVNDRKAESYRNYLWFDYVKVKAENAYLSAHLKDLAGIAGEQ
jgi:hypothetical protein